MYYILIGYLVDHCYSLSLRNDFKLHMDTIDEIANWYYGMDQFGSDICYSWRRVSLLHIQVSNYTYLPISGDT